MILFDVFLVNELKLGLADHAETTLVNDVPLYLLVRLDFNFCINIGRLISGVFDIWRGDDIGEILFFVISECVIG